MDILLNKWNDLSTKLEENTTLNKSILRKMMMEKPKGVWNKVLKYQDFDLWFGVIVMILMFGAAIANFNSPGNFFLFLIVALASIPAFFFKKKEMIVAKKVNIESESIADSLAKVSLAQQASIKYFKGSLWSIILIPFLAPLVFAGIQNTTWDTFYRLTWLQEMTFEKYLYFTGAMLLGGLIGALVAYSLYQKKVFANIKELKILLKELR